MMNRALQPRIKYRYKWLALSASGSLDITFPTGTTIAPGGYFLIERRELATTVLFEFGNCLPLGAQR